MEVRADLTHNGPRSGRRFHQVRASMASFSTTGDSESFGYAPPPPGGYVRVAEETDGPRRRRVKSRPPGRPFSAELDASEIDERLRPGPVWTARARELSRSHIIIASRRMCYVGRVVIMAIHLIDAEPTPLFGRVIDCEYDGDGLYRLDIDLLECPEHREIKTWLEVRTRHRQHRA